MRMSVRKSLGVLALAVSCVLTSNASAREAAENAEPNEETAAKEEGDSKRNNDPMNGIGFGLKAGYLYYGAIEYKNALGQQQSAGSRGEPTLNFELYLGDGFGFAWDTELYFAFANKSASVVGGYLGPAFRFHIKRMYFSVGVGLRLGYVKSDVFDLSSPVDKGLDIYGRIPITLTYYVADWLGLLVEFGFGVGGTGVKLKQDPNVPLPGTLEDYQFGTAGTMDLSFGFRLP